MIDSASPVDARCADRGAGRRPKAQAMLVALASLRPAIQRRDGACLARRKFGIDHLALFSLYGRNRLASQPRRTERVDLNDSPQQAEFRAKVRSWLEEHKAEAPPRAPTGDEDAYIQARREWQGKLAEAGLAGVTWPKEFGGQGLGPIEHVKVNQEVGRF